MPSPLTAILLVPLLTAGIAQAVEEPRFTVEARTTTYEIRRYEPVLVAETPVTAAFDEAGNAGFRVLAGYIFGNNQTRARIAMTAPVIQEAAGSTVLKPSAEGFVVQFTMPAGSALATLPTPNDPRVRLRELPARRIAVLGYSGSWSEARYQAKAAALLATLKKDGIRTLGAPVLARFDSPFQLWFLRRNEVWVELDA
jgi:SOUL heme-binding protein